MRITPAFTASFSAIPPATAIPAALATRVFEEVDVFATCARNRAGEGPTGEDHHRRRKEPEEIKIIPPPTHHGFQCHYNTLSLKAMATPRACRSLTVAALTEKHTGTDA